MKTVFFFWGGGGGGVSGWVGGEIYSVSAPDTEIS